MNYEEKYKNALERAKKMLASKRSVIVEKQALETIFPELAESEDERIRKELLDYLHTRQVVEGLTDTKVKMDWVTWLEKQGQKPAVSDDANKEGMSFTITQDQMDDWLKKYVDAGKQDAWNDADEERFLSCLKRLGTGNEEQPDTINTMWLKSIKNRVQTIAKFVGEEQYMKGVRDGVNDVIKHPEDYGLLPSSFKKKEK